MSGNAFADRERRRRENKKEMLREQIKIHRWDWQGIHRPG
jgi:hypothetical protein